MTHNRRRASMLEDLPAELLEMILKRLTLDNNIRASLVCKRWHSIATSIRVLIYSPLLIYSNIHGDKYEFYDPLKHKTYYVEFPELSESIICYAKDGWLLHKFKTQQLFFFNPFTRDMIKLPRVNKKNYSAAFSCAPPSSECILFMVGYVNPLVVTISTCYPGSVQWTTTNYQNQLPLSLGSNILNKVVFSNGLFYCLTFDGLLAKFNTTERSWTVQSILIPKCPNKFCATNLFNGELIFLIEQEGDIIAISRCSSENPIVFTLDQTLIRGRETMTFDRVPLFVGFMPSSSRTYLRRRMRNHADFPVHGRKSRSIISFSLDDSKSGLHKNWFPLYTIGRFDDSIWIDPPKDFSGFK